MKKKVLSFEHKSEELISRTRFANRLLLYFFYASIIILFSISLGVLGYHYIADLSWVDAILNASMILTGMGPVNQLVNDNAKIFASFYALYSGVAFLSTIGLFLTPVIHRIMHQLHIER